MSKHIGEVGQRMTRRLTLKGEYTYTKCIGWKTTECHLYFFEDDEGNNIIWKTTALLGMDVEDHDAMGRDNLVWDGANRGDIMTVKATIKAHGEYKDEPQTELTRLKIVRYDYRAPTREEIMKQMRDEQEATIGEKDIVWRMPYRQYKDHYADCETIVGSYDRDERKIAVIIREGRLVPSGTRGERFYRFIIEDADGVHHGYRAVSEQNALKQFAKDGRTGGKVVRII